MWPTYVSLQANTFPHWLHLYFLSILNICVLNLFFPRKVSPQQLHSLGVLSGKDGFLGTSLLLWDFLCFFNSLQVKERKSFHRDCNHTPFSDASFVTQKAFVSETFPLSHCKSRLLHYGFWSYVYPMWWISQCNIHEHSFNRLSKSCHLGRPISTF